MVVIVHAAVSRLCAVLGCSAPLGASHALRGATHRLSYITPQQSRHCLSACACTSCIPSHAPLLAAAAAASTGTANESNERSGAVQHASHTRTGARGAPRVEADAHSAGRRGVAGHRARLQHARRAPAADNGAQRHGKEAAHEREREQLESVRHARARARRRARAAALAVRLHGALALGFFHRARLVSQCAVSVSWIRHARHSLWHRSRCQPARCNLNTAHVLKVFGSQYAAHSRVARGAQSGAQSSSLCTQCLQQQTRTYRYRAVFVNRSGTRVHAAPPAASSRRVSCIW